MAVILLILGLILAQGNGFVVQSTDLQPYWRTYVKTHGAPAGLQAKREILQNYLGDFLMIKRAEELKLDKSREFLEEWKDAKEEVEKRCKKEGISGDACKKIRASVRKLLLISLVVGKEVFPKIRISEKEITDLVRSHRGKKGHMNRGRAVKFLEAREQSRALHAYVETLMKRYNVKINEVNLKKLDLGPPAT